MTETKKQPTTTEAITLKALCKEVNLDPREARLRLRYAIKTQKAKFPALVKSHLPRQPWSWPKGSEGYLEAKKAVSECFVPKPQKPIDKAK